MKKTIAVLLLIALLMTAAGCTGGGTEPTEKETLPKQTEATEPSQTEPEPETDPALDALRQQMSAEGKTFAVAYLGFMPSDCGTLDAYINSLSDQTHGKIPFLNRIPQTNRMGSAYGEVYCVVLADPETTMEVFTGSEDAGYHNRVYEGSGEDPFLLVCNAEAAPDTELAFTGSNGLDIRWNPRLDAYLYIEQLRYANGTTPSLDFSPYNALLISAYEQMLESGDWEIPTKTELQNTTWCWDLYTDMVRYHLYQVSFREDAADVRWNPGYGDTNEYQNAGWTLEEKQIAVLTMDFGTFAGVRKYNLLIDREAGMLYIAEDATGKDLIWNSEPQYRFLLLDQSQKTQPTDLIGTWERTQTEVDGYVEPTPAGLITLRITGTNETDLRITYTDLEFPENGYENKGMTIVTNGDAMGFGDVKWTAEIDHTGRFGQTFTVAIVEDMLLIRNYFTVDGAPGVSYETFRRVN